jgi:hypothetical protein
MRFRQFVTAVAAYVGVALAFFWPLPLYLSTKLPGDVTDDTAVYVWNIWHFRHQLLQNKLPYFTDVVLSLAPGTDLSLHNYTTFANVLAFPLIPLFGVTATFNIICMALTVMTAACTYLLALRAIGRVPEAWIAGAAFAFSPALITRSTGHFSLVAAAPLPVFLLCLLNAAQTRNLWWGWAAGAAMAWAVLCDPYYGIVCLLAGACFLAVEWLRVRSRARSRTAGVVLALDLLAVTIAGFVAFIVVTGGARFALFGHSIGMQSLYTPMLMFAVVIVLRLWIIWRPQATLSVRFQALCVSKFALTTAAMCALLLAPMLHALAYRLADGGTFHKPVTGAAARRGRSAGVVHAEPEPPDLRRPVALVALSSSGNYLETCRRSLFVAIAVLTVAVWRFRFRPPMRWVAYALLFVTLALGPFIHVAGVNTYVPGPWAFLRYVPLVSAARAPARFGSRRARRLDSRRRPPLPGAPPGAQASGPGRGNGSAKPSCPRAASLVFRGGACNLQDHRERSA